MAAMPLSCCRGICSVKDQEMAAMLLSGVLTLSTWLATRSCSEALGSMLSPRMRIIRAGLSELKSLRSHRKLNTGIRSCRCRKDGKLQQCGQFVVSSNSNKSRLRQVTGLLLFVANFAQQSIVPPLFSDEAEMPSKFR
eukprot:1159576-Pelagomonas_calceolata.AAC.10